MIKPNSLREAIVAALPELAREPERLTIAVEKGRIVATGARPAGVAAFEYRYTLTLTALDFAGDPDVLFTAILIWVAGHQRELLDGYVSGAKDGIGFEVDVLDNSKVDVEVQLPLTEAVGVTAGVGGKWEFNHYPEPPDAARAVAEASGLALPDTVSGFLHLVANGEPVEP